MVTDGRERERERPRPGLLHFPSPGLIATAQQKPKDGPPAANGPLLLLLCWGNNKGSFRNVLLARSQQGGVEDHGYGPNYQPLLNLEIA